MNKLDKKSEVATTQIAVEKAMAAVIAYIKNTENPIAEAAHELIDAVLSDCGCESPEGHIVAGGDQAVDPHEIGFGILPKNKPIVIDIYPRNRRSGFYADMTRTFCKGSASHQASQIYQDVLAAQTKACSMLKHGVLCSDIQSTIESFFDDLGYSNSGKGREFIYKEGFVHGVGHGVSTVLHDRPRIGRNTSDVLSEGDIVTIEPGLYYLGIGGIRIEDMFLITKDGYRKISHFSYEFEI